MYNQYTCTSCIGGFQLSGWNCQSTFNYGFFVSLNTDLTTFYNQYQAFLAALLVPLDSTNVRAFTITSILPGSVNVTGTISTLQPSNSNGAGNEFYGIQNTLNAGSIANMPILTYTLNANGGAVPPQSSGPNLAIILGICIPVGVLILGAIIYFVFIRKNNSNTQPVNYTSNQSSNRQTFELTKEEQTL